MPGVAAKNPFDRQPAAFEHAVFSQGVLGVMGTGGVKTTTVTYKRGERQAIDID